MTTQKIQKVLETFLWMFTCGVAAGLMAVNLVPHLVGKNEEERLTPLLILFAVFVGFLAPAFVVRHLHKREGPWRFSLRTMLIATTLVAVVLGMIAWLDRAWIGK